MTPASNQGPPPVSAPLRWAALLFLVAALFLAAGLGPAVGIAPAAWGLEAQEAGSPASPLACGSEEASAGHAGDAGPADGRRTRPAVPPLDCVDLVATPRMEGARGVIRLVPPSSPFGVAVTPRGVHEYRLRGRIEGLPDPSELGPYSTYVAWATPLVLTPVRKLGTVENGPVELGRVDFNKFMILVSAEPSADVEERTGPLVLRGRSPSSLMVAHDLLAQAPSAEQWAPAAPPGDGEGETDGWSRPPPYPEVDMLPGIAAVRPSVSPLRLEAPGGEEPPRVRPRRIVDLPDGGTLDLTAGYVTRRIRDRDLTMLAFNGQHPGPLIRVDRASTIFVNFHNETPFPTTVHWHGIRLENAFDGVPGLTQEPVEPGESFRYRIRFPDAGLYWYHPHHREDVQQELGLYGNLLVDPLAPDYFGPANRDEYLMLDDLLLGDDGIAPFGREAATHSLMGRFGNLLLVNGEPRYELEVDRGEVVRFHLTNASNTRTFNLSLVREGENVLPLKVVASDVSRFEREERVRSVVLAPAERYVVEARFPEAGSWALVNHVQGINHRQGLFLAERSRLGTIRVADEAVETDHADAFDRLRRHDEVVRDIDRYRHRFDDPPDRHLVLDLEVEGLASPVRQSMLFDRTYFNPVEWAGTMPMMNWATTGREVRWILRDPETGRENMDVEWRYRVGDVVKIRIRNERDAFHAMQHPIHIHGQRFLVLEQDGVPNENLVWKDTALLPVGSTTDILLEISNPGRWMVHCHIAEHLESGMKLVLEAEGESP